MRLTSLGFLLATVIGGQLAVSPGGKLAQRVAPNPLEFDASWTHIGPQPLQRETLLAGWMTALAVDPRNGNVVYGGAAGGGVWKTQDGGLNWRPLTDDLPSLSTGSIALDPSAPDTVYVGTGYLEHSSPNSYYGAGILKSVDGGDSWTHLPGPFAGPLGREQGGASIVSLAVHPTSGDIVLAGVRGGGDVGSGVYRSTDGGVSWARVLGGGLGAAVLVNPDNGDIAYAAISLGSANGVYKSTDAGTTWAPVGGSGNGGLPSSNVGLIAMAIAPSDPSVLYVGITTTVPGPNGLLGLFKTSDGGQTWTRLVNTPQYCSSACWRRHVISVHPSNPDLVYAGGRLAGSNLYRTLDGGDSWTEVSRSIDGLQLFADLTALTFSRDGTRLYVANDGGVFRTTNATAPAPLKWENLNRTLDLTGVSPGFSMHPTDINIGFAGPQEGGVSRYSGSLPWQGGMICGDGGATVIDPQVPNTVYAACQPDLTALYKTVSGGFPRYTSWVPAQTGIDTSDRNALWRPLVMDPTNSQRLYFATFRLYQTNDGAESWNPISGDLAGPQSALSAVAVGPANPNMIYVGSSGITYRGSLAPSPIAGHVFVTTNADAGSGARWTDRTSGLPPRGVTQIVVDPESSLTAFVGFAGFSGFSGDAQGHLFKTTNGGASWTDVSANLPNVPVNAIVLDDVAGTIYVGTDTGVFVTVDGGLVWSPLMSGLPHAVITGLKLHQPSRTLRAATYGRGLWDLKVPKGAVVQRAQPITPPTH
jgi:photosystem II stability/assembly factor-like uncharacterized protein